MKKENQGRGGMRPGAGRKRLYNEPTVRPTVYLPKSAADYIASLGGGNLSEGIMHLYATHRGRKQ